MPLFNADQIVELKEMVKQYHAIGRQDFVQIARVFRQSGQETDSRWMKALGHEKIAATLQEAEWSDDTGDWS
jgi:2,4-dienoyl-CoA reductase-like NADH-dependent reductase (Old Yellow Enzyme family)